jgi:hypothetical protein
MYENMYEDFLCLFFEVGVEGLHQAAEWRKNKIIQWLRSGRGDLKSEK